MEKSSLRHIAGHGLNRLPSLWGAPKMSALNYRIHARARELLETLPEPLTFKKMVGEVIKTRREMRRISRSQYR